MTKFSRYDIVELVEDVVGSELAQGQRFVVLGLRAAKYCAPDDEVGSDWMLEVSNTTFSHFRICSSKFLKLDLAMPFAIGERVEALFDVSRFKSGRVGRVIEISRSNFDGNPTYFVKCEDSSGTTFFAFSDGFKSISKEMS